ncbi:EF-hand domain-containing protein [Nonomuraea sp. NPDC046570]|uniref:EF-hand domain-containing protein n=1 Tax=Nonomuraea sp. NPDC046570 TaxID=3155255 RepID=UPI003406AAC5
MTSAWEEAKAEFERFDADNDGLITADEIREASKALGQTISDAEVENAIKVADRDGDGRIALEEFIQLVGGGRHGRR